MTLYGSATTSGVRTCFEIGPLARPKDLLLAIPAPGAAHTAAETLLNARAWFKCQINAHRGPRQQGCGACGGAGKHPAT